MNRRGFLSGLASLVCAAPAIVKASSLMPVKALEPDNLDALCALLSARIDEAKAVMERNLARSIFEYKGHPIADTTYLRASGLGGTLINYRPREGWEISDKPAVVKAYSRAVADNKVNPPLLPKYERKDLGSFDSWISGLSRRDALSS